MPNPVRISIALCTYNGSAHLPQQLDSIAGQLLAPDELHIFDDASTDDCAGIARRFSTTARFAVSVHVNERNLGPTKNFEQAIAACDGDAIALCDQDDVWRPEKLARIAAEFERSPNLGFAFTDADVCDERAEPLGYTLWKSVGFTPMMRARLRRGRPFEVILRQNVVTGATMAFSSRFKPLVLPIDPRWVHDGWIALLIAATGAPVRISDEPMIRYRQHATQAIGALRRSLLQQYRNARDMSRQVFAEHAEMYQAAYERLTAVSHQFPVAPEVLAMLEQKIQHFRTRSQIRLGERGRILSSVSELVSLRYRRYSMGWKSFAQDLFL
jgi:glycosyltransferase involved in cell wall biosynthesis